MSAADDRIRLDKWLWQARFFKTRSLAARVVEGGHVRVNGEKVAKPGRTVRAGDVLTFSQARQVRVVRIVAAGLRRGPAPEARTLYEDLDPPLCPREKDAVPESPRFEGKGRPTKRDRRKHDLNRKGALD